MRPRSGRTDLTTLGPYILTSSQMFSRLAFPLSQKVHNKYSKQYHALLKLQHHAYSPSSTYVTSISLNQFWNLRDTHLIKPLLDSQLINSCLLNSGIISSDHRGYTSLTARRCELTGSMPILRSTVRSTTNLYCAFP